MVLSASCNTCTGRIQTKVLATLPCSLPPANEVWGKVMFLHLCVILFTEGLCPSMHHRSHDRGFCVPGSMSTRSLSTGSLSRGGSLSGGLCLGASVQGASVQGDSVWGSLSKGSLSRASLSMVVSVQGVSVQGDLCLGVSVWESLSRGSLSWGLCLRGGLCPRGGHCPGVSVPEWVSVPEGVPVPEGVSVPEGSLSWGVSIRGLCPVGLCPGVSVLPYGNKWAVSLLLECILVS